MIKKYLAAINDGEKLEKSVHEIYSPEFVLENNNTWPFETSLLDLNIKILSKRFMLGLYGKRDSFPFSTMKMPHLSSNSPAKIFSLSLEVGKLRIGRKPQILRMISRLFQEWFMNWLMKLI